MEDDFRCVGSFVAFLLNCGDVPLLIAEVARCDGCLLTAGVVDFFGRFLGATGCGGSFVLFIMVAIARFLLDLHG